MFHLFESLVSNIAGLIQKQSAQLISSLPTKINIKKILDKENNEIENTLNEKNEGFFADNLRTLLKS